MPTEVPTEEVVVTDDATPEPATPTAILVRPSATPTRIPTPGETPQPTDTPEPEPTVDPAHARADRLPTRPRPCRPTEVPPTEVPPTSTPAPVPPTNTPVPPTLATDHRVAD